MSSAIDEYDIREAFDALDVECRGRLSFSQLQTLYLGLGFGTTEATRRMSESTLKHDALHLLGYYADKLSLDETLRLFQNVGDMTFFIPDSLFLSISHFTCLFT